MLESIYEYCRAKPSVTEGFPFDQDTLVFKVGGKIFALLALDETPLRMNLKADPLQAIEWREAHETIIPGFHMNKKHWNTVVVDGSLPQSLIFEMINHSYERVVSGMTKTQREALQGA